MVKTVAFCVVVGSSFGLLSVLAFSHMPSLGSIFRQRLRDLLDRQGLRQGALADYLGVDHGRLSKILKFDAEAGTVKLERLEQIANFLRLPVADLLRSPMDAPIDLSKDESELVELYRRLPEEQRSNLLAWLAFVFTPTISAERERRALAILRQNLDRQSREMYEQLRGPKPPNRPK